MTLRRSYGLQGVVSRRMPCGWPVVGNNQERRHGCLTNSLKEMETENCPASLAEFCMIWVEWEKSDGSRGKSERLFNNRQGRREVSDVFESVLIEDQALKLGLKGVWIQGARLEQAKTQAEEATRRRVLKENEIPDPH